MSEKKTDDEMSNDEVSAKVTFEDQDTLRRLCGPNDKHLRLLRRKLGVQMSMRGDELSIKGDGFAVELAEEVMGQLYAVARHGHPIYPPDVLRAVDILSADSSMRLESVWLDTVLVAGAKARIGPKNLGQKQYVEAIRTQDVVFGTGPAGTGKTYLAMAMAVAALSRNEFKRIVLTRPAVEAGEKLGFLPGDLADKVNPYLRPLYDALNDMMDIEKARRLIEKGVIEVAPLAFMRGRTLNDSFVILDEAQNSTVEQMKMFLTRLGYNSKAVITGDVTQTDLEGRQSGLAHALRILDNVEGIGVVRFTEKDVVRHPLVQKIIVAYDRFDREREAARTAATALRAEERAAEEALRAEERAAEDALRAEEAADRRERREALDASRDL
jgi:phosphate starvation-inducible PhoH-like protein